MIQYTHFSAPKNFHEVDRDWSIKYGAGFEKYANRFYTRPLGQLMSYFNLFYIKRDNHYIKIVPKNISKIVLEGLDFYLLDRVFYSLILRWTLWD